MSILNKYKRWKMPLLLALDKYWDFVLSLDNGVSIDIDGENTNECLSTYIDFSDAGCVGDGYVVSKNSWDDAVNEGAELDDIGLTGMDNGLIRFDKDKIEPEDFLELLTASTYSVTTGDTRLLLNEVSGNTKAYSYKICMDDGYATLLGGFYQGFFKLDGFEYQVLPDAIDDSLEFEFTLRPREYVTDKKTLNTFYPNNKGIFFYIGTRSENKFAKMYGEDLSQYPDRDTSERYNCDNYFYDDYFDYGSLPISSDTESSAYTDLTASTINLSDGSELMPFATKEVETDNKFIFFDRTKDGYTVKTWDSSITFVLEFRKYLSNTNLFLVMNRTKTGLTKDDRYLLDDGVVSYDIETDSIVSGTSGNTDYKPYNIISDITSNAFALKVNDDMSIGYRYAIKDCDAESGYSIKEETTFPNVLQNDKWSVVNVKFKILDGPLDKCETNKGLRKMKIYIYVDGFLKFVSQELPELNLRALNDDSKRQEGVPYNISLGGGTQGMAESIWLKYKEMFPKVLPLEENFAGTFIGDIKTFKIYTCGLQYNQIKNNYLFEKARIING